MLTAALLFLAAAQADVPEARDAFRARQDDLILLAGSLGTLHRLNQVCPGYGNVAVFRDRMQEVVNGERPIRATREAMIEAFNGGYNAAAQQHVTCGRAAETDLRQEALNALSLVERLSAEMASPSPRR
ncbi:MAG: TIGR02301 family protein [Pseudomonadota bacterium]